MVSKLDCLHVAVSSDSIYLVRFTHHGRLDLRAASPQLAMLSLAGGAKVGAFARLLLQAFAA